MKNAISRTATRNVSLIALACAGLFMQAAQAQTGTAPLTRAEVKAEAIAAAASKPKGEMSTPNQDKGMRSGPSTTTRAEVKAEAIAAAASKPKGEMSTPNQDKGMQARPSNTTRAAVKAEMAASKAMAEGERSVPKKTPNK